MSNVITADNKEANGVHGYVRSHRHNYNEDVLTNDLYETGIHEFSS